MSNWYLDTSAAGKLLVAEPESEALSSTLDSEQPSLVACYLLETEVRRMVQRTRGRVSQEAATHLLDRVNLHETPPALFREAGLLSGENLRSIDALHLAAAISIGVDQVVTYDQRMQASARELGLPVCAPAQVAGAEASH